MQGPTLVAARGLPPGFADAFRAAIGAAETFRGATAPNPPVGCALLDRAGRTLALAAHARAGLRHAEAEAIDLCRQAGTLGQIHTVVVTLEPCNHFGRTPPCAEALLETPAQVVWIGVSDPNPRVPGGGRDRLRQAGLEVNLLEAGTFGAIGADLAEACRDLVRPFAKRMLTGRPWVRVKQALDPKGSMIPPPGAKTFTSAEALTFAHHLRKRADAILTGSGTILADDPAFTVRRIVDHAGKRRHLAILDRRGRVPRAYLAAAEARGFIVHVSEDLEAALDALGRAGALEVLVEAGPTLTGHLLATNLWDDHILIRQGDTGLRDRASLHRRQDGLALDLPLGSPDAASAD